MDGISSILATLHTPQILRCAQSMRTPGFSLTGAEHRLETQKLKGIWRVRIQRFNFCSVQRGESVVPGGGILSIYRQRRELEFSSCNAPPVFNTSIRFAFSYSTSRHRHLDIQLVVKLSEHRQKKMRYKALAIPGKFKPHARYVHSSMFVDMQPGGAHIFIDGEAMRAPV